MSRILERIKRAGERLPEGRLRNRIRPAYKDAWWLLRSPLARPTIRFVRHRGLTVREGPFAGMRYPLRMTPRPLGLVTRLLGSFEMELHSCIEQALIRQPEAIVNIGAADGYYTVGTALRCPDARVLAFEVDPYYRNGCAQLARRNGVAHRVELRGLCTPDELRTLALPEGTLVISDCEGAERSLIDPDEVPWLRGGMLLVELHERLVPGIEATLRERLAGTHRLEVIEGKQRYLDDHRSALDVPGLTPPAMHILLYEFRDWPASWLYAVPG